MKQKEMIMVNHIWNFDTHQFTIDTVECFMTFVNSSVQFQIHLWIYLYIVYASYTWYRIQAVFSNKSKSLFEMKKMPV